MDTVLSIEQFCSTNRVNRDFLVVIIQWSKMKIGTKLILSGILSILIGSAFASPLLVSELNIRPWIKHVQGPTAEFSVNVVYANFTILNGSKPVDENDGSAISYYVVLNVTNLSDLGAKLLEVNFVAAGQISNVTESLFLMYGTSGSGYFVEGAWVDGVWYNVTWATYSWPAVDRWGNITIFPDPWENITGSKGYWMEGVQLLDVYEGGKFKSTYMNMNGTWTNVTGRINFTRPEGTNPFSNGVSISNTVVSEFHVFQAPMPFNTTSTITSSDGTSIDSKVPGHIETKYTWVGDGLFDNYWAPHQSRLILLQGTRDIIKPWADVSALNVLKSGNITFQTRLFNYANVTVGIFNGTIEDTWSYATERKQVQLTEIGDSYLYNTILCENEMFQTDQFGVEVFIRPRS